MILLLAWRGSQEIAGEVELRGEQSPASPPTAANEAAREARIISQHTLPAAGQAEDPVLASLPHFKHPCSPLSLKTQLCMWLVYQTCRQSHNQDNCLNQTTETASDSLS